MDVQKLKTPFSMSICAGRGAGKTYFTKELIMKQSEMIDQEFDKIYWIYKHVQPIVFQDLFQTAGEIKFLESIPDFSSWDKQKNTLVILDDYMQEASDDPSVVQLFTNGRHKNISVIFLSQNLFHQGKYSRSITLNSDYITLFKAVRDKMQIKNIGKQMYPENSRFFIWAYEEATTPLYGHLLLDFKADTEERYRLRMDIFGKNIYLVPNNILNKL